MSNLIAIQDLGQSVWLNYLRRAFIESGELREALDDGITGITSSPAIFAKAITDSADYDEFLQELVAQGMSIKKIYQALVADDLQRAADVLHPIFELSEGRDGYVTVELNPALAHDAVGTIAEARHLLALINRANVMIEIPATPAGISAIETLTGDGVNVNVTHIFALDTYEEVARAYIKGIEDYISTHSVWRQTPASVTSFSLSRIDGRVDAKLKQLGHEELMGKTAISLAKLVYKRFCQLFSGPAWEKLENRGAHVQRPKWTRTTPHNFMYPDTYYVEALIGPDTVNTVSPATFNAFRDHGQVAESLTSDMDQAENHLQSLSKLGLDLDAIGQELQEQSLGAFEKYHQALVQSVSNRRDELESEWHRMVVDLGGYEPAMDVALTDFCLDRIMCRIWAHDHTVWKSDPAEISNRLGWLHIAEAMQENLDRLAIFAQGVKDDGIEDVVVLGMGGSSLAPELYARSFGPWVRLVRPDLTHLNVTVLDTTDPDAIRSVDERLNLSKTLFLVASKSGQTVETLSIFRFFYNQVLSKVGEANAGSHFVAITDPDTGLVDLAGKHDFRDIFINAPTIGGRYSALSYFGLVPAALVGLDLETLLERALAMATNASSCNCPLKGDNISAQLGTIMGEMAKKGRDKLTVITSPSIGAFGDWIEQLVAESTGKEGRGILPVVGESTGAPDVYGDDRLFIYVRLEGDETHDQEMESLAEAGYPIVTLHLKDIYDLGGMFFTWEMATAVAGYYLGIQPFNQPDVEAAKQMTRKMVADFQETGVLPVGEGTRPSAELLEEFLDQSEPGDYVAIHAYVQPTADTDRALQALRTGIREHYQIATTVGYGPRYLHSTGQLHKGDGGNGLFIQLTSDPVKDLPIPDVAGSPESQLSFGTLKLAQALGDGQALEQKRRRLLRFHLGTDVLAGLQEVVAING